MKNKSYPTICPEELFDIANHFAMAIGEGPAEQYTWRTAPFEKDGVRYGTYNLTLSENQVRLARNPLNSPEWDTDGIVDLIAASQCQALLDMIDVKELEENSPFPQPSPDRILVLINYSDISSAVQHWGLSMITQEEDD